MFKLRPYQNECINTILSKFNLGVNRQIVSLPTAAGKTVVFASLIQKLQKKTLILAHTGELLQQAKDKIKMISPGCKVGIVNGTLKEFDNPVIVSSIQSARIPKNLDKLINKGFDLCIVDECHHTASDTYRKVLQELSFGQGTPKLLVGFSATAFRNDKRGLLETFDEIVFQKSIKEMIFDGYLCKPIGKKLAFSIDFKDCKMEKDDFNQKSLAFLMDNEEVRSKVVEAYQDHALGRPAICFCVNVEHSKNLAIDFQNRGIKSEAVYGELPILERETILKQYASGDIDVLCNCMILTEGFDEPKTACVIVARPTKSKGLYQQMVGRGLRLYPGKNDCIIIDTCDVNHSICTIPTLTEDAEVLSAQKDEQPLGNMQGNNIPAGLSPKLKTILLNYNPLGDGFQWVKKDNFYLMEGNRLTLYIMPQGDELFSCIVEENGSKSCLAKNLDFGYAFGVAEDFANSRKSAFILADRNAKWRDDPISDSQIKELKKRGFRKGIQDLKKGQASDILNELFKR